MSIVTVLICGAILTAAVLVTLIRVERGPSILDRIVALDVLVASIIGCFAVLSAWTGRVDLVPVLTVLALVGFVGSVTLARFAAAEPEEERRILTHEESAEVDRMLREQEEEQ